MFSSMKVKYLIYLIYNKAMNNFVQGSFPFSMPGNKPLQLLSVKDMGLAAGIALKQVCFHGTNFSGCFSCVSVT